MRIWDIHPGYLNRQSLLGEHRELHGIVSIIVNGKKGYSRHPETLRWIDHGWALQIRHKLLSCEMALRHYTDRSPVTLFSSPGVWPIQFIDPPARQFQILKEKYIGKEEGRIPLPGNQQQLWSQHKYSVLARNPLLYKEIGHKVSKNSFDFAALSMLLIETLREKPDEGGIRNAVQHMWGYVSEKPKTGPKEKDHWSVKRYLLETQKRAMDLQTSYLTASTALSELMVWLPDDGA